MRSILDPKDQARLLHHRSPTHHGKVSSPSQSPSQSNNYKHENKKRERECDFYINPTLTSRLILHQKYSAAIRRLQQHPSEASVWVCVKRKQTPPPKSKDNDAAGSDHDHDHDDDDNYSMRQLPLHMACQDLARVGIEASNRALLEEMIAHLILAYPAACAKQDHSGSFPLHEAIWYTATPETVSHLLCGAPEIANANDQYGRSCIYLNRHCRSRTPEDQARVQVMLQRGVSFWETALQEARLRLRHRNVPASSASIDSMSVLATAAADDNNDYDADNDGDDSTIQTTNDASLAARSEHSVSDGKHDKKSHTKKTDTDYAQTLEPWSWSQLEQRAQRLEHLLAEALESYFKVSVAKSQLEMTQVDTEKKYRLLVADTGNEQLGYLEQENAQLRRDKHQLEELLQRKNLALDEGTIDSKPIDVTEVSVREDIMPKDAAAAAMITSLQEDKRKLEINVDELTRQNTDYKRKLNHFEKVLDSFPKSQQESLEEDSLTITSAARGLEHLTMSKPMGRGGADNGSNNEDDDGAEQIKGEHPSSDLVDAWKSSQLHPSYSAFSTGAEAAPQEDDDAFGSLLRETFQAYNDSKAGDPVGSMENVEDMYPVHERISHSTDGEKSSGTGLNDLFAEAAAALYDN
jgi:hypothetical protein